MVVEILMERDLILKKGNTWHFGYKAHIGIDDKNGIVHTIKTTAANERIAARLNMSLRW